MRDWATPTLIDVALAMLTLDDAPVFGGASMEAKQGEYRVGRWRFDRAEPVLRSGAVSRRLEDRAARTLAVLCERRGQIVSKAELLELVWQGRSVSPNSVAIVIGALRRALEDDPRAPAFIVTVGKRGYRLEPETAPEPVQERPARYRPRRLLLAGAAVLAGTSLLLLQPSPGRPTIDLVVPPTGNETGRTALDPLARALTPVVTDGALQLRGVRVVGPGAPHERGRRRVLLRSRLIMWNGAPELAMTATDPGTGSVLWSAFAAGPAGSLARATEARIATLAEKLPR